MTFPALGSIRPNGDPTRKGFHSFQAGAPLGFSWTLSPRRINTKTKHQEEEEEEEERRIGLYCRRHETRSSLSPQPSEVGDQAPKRGHHAREHHHLMHLLISCRRRPRILEVYVRYLVVGALEVPLSA